MKRLENKVAIVTGGTSGIGAEVCRTFGANGAKVVVAGRNIERGEKVVADILAAGGEACFIQTDITKEADITNLVEKAVEKYGKLDVMVNNAGITVPTPLVSTSAETWDSIMDSNLKSVFLSIKYSAPYIEKTKGSIINVASIAAIKGIAYQSAYSASKAGVTMLTKCAALELGPVGVRCNCVCPGVVETPIIEGTPQEVFDAVTAQIPLKRIGQTSDLAGIIVYLASDESIWTTGVVMPVDGGNTL